MKRWQSLLLGLVITAATLAYVLNGIDFSRLGTELAQGRYLYLVPALALIVLGLVLRGVRWRVLLDDKIDLGHSFHIMNVGYFFNAWLPLRLGEVARSFLVTRLKPPLSIFTALSSIVVERVTDLLAVVVLIVLAMSMTPVSPEIKAAAQATGVLAVAGIIVLTLFASRRALAHRMLGLVLRVLPFLERLHLRQIADRVLDGLTPLASLRGIFRTLLWTALSWLASILAGFVLLYVYYDAPNLTSALLMIAVASIAIALPAVPGNVGPFEAAVVLGLQAGGLAGGGLPEERAVAFAVLLHIVTVGSYAFLGFLGLAQERISFGEVVRSARQLASKKEAQPESPESLESAVNSTPQP
jgi:uncharacterized protein (TIRG00374 family)